MDRNHAHRISLAGDLSMNGVTEQFPLLSQHLVRSGEVATSPELRLLHEIDLSRVQTIDACGCQLLVAFVRNLRKRGADVSMHHVTDECREIIRSLGFDGELLSEATHEA